jgi:hypothetical protein
MKKLILVIALGVSGVGFGQTSKEVTQWKKDCDCDSSLAVKIHNDVSEVNNWVSKTHMFKTGDTDKSACVGILKDIFTDPTAKFKYAKINPRIAQLQVKGYAGLDTISYSKWIASIPVYDTSKYMLEYSRTTDEGLPDNHDDDKRVVESINVFDKFTARYIRGIFITYDQRNFRVITDSYVSYCCN